MKIIINSLPKSGTNLLAKLLDLSGYTERAFIGSQRYLTGGLRGFYFKLTSLKWSQGYMVGIDTPIEVNKFFIDRVFKSCRDGDYIITHAGYTDNLLQKAINLNFRPVLVIRDPRAVLNSFVKYIDSTQNHPLHSFFSKLNLEDKYFFGLYGGKTSSGILLQSLITRCCALENWRLHQSVLTVRFEDLVGDKGGGSNAKQLECLERIFLFAQLEKEHIYKVQQSLFGTGRHTFRSGQINAWESEIPSDIIPHINQNLTSVLDRWAYYD